MIYAHSNAYVYVRGIVLAFLPLLVEQEKLVVHSNQLAIHLPVLNLNFQYHLILSKFP